MPDWFDDFLASHYCPSVKPWQWDDAPLGWKQRVLVAGMAMEQAKVATQPTPRITPSA
jgi:hypothetical protein